MKKILLALVLLALPAFATDTSGSDPYGGVQGTLVAASDTVTLSVLGTRWSTVAFQIITAGSAPVSAQVSNDGATNFPLSVCARKLNTVSANPTVVCLSGSSVTTGDIWEVALPSNATHFRLFSSGGTATIVKLYGGLPYVPGAPVTGVLFDTTSGVNTAIDTGTLDLSGWEYANASYTTPAGGSGTISMVDDAGTSVTMFTPPASAGAWYPFAVSSPSVSQVTALPATGSTGALPIQKRMRFQSAAVAALTSRIRIEVRR